MAGWDGGVSTSPPPWAGSPNTKRPRQREMPELRQEVVTVWIRDFTTKMRWEG